MMTRQWIKLWPQLAIASWKNNAGGAFRAWALARAADTTGSGRIDQDELSRGVLSTAVGVTSRTCRRWINKSIVLGLLVPDRGAYQIVSLARCAIILKCRHIGNPADIPVNNLFGDGWKAFIWAAFNATLSGPVSQETKQEMTGVPVRTQQYYLAQLQLEKTTNYAKRDLPADSDYLIGYEEETDRVVFINEQGEVIQKLPDQITVPESVAVRSAKGRSRKAQKAINAALFLVEQGGLSKRTMRLWHTTRRGLKATIKRTAEWPLADLADDVFLKGHRVSRAVFWEPEPLFSL